ncbi:uncharacterized protein AMSG_11722 [Thecamonas trahens ATCC 50062]|uniref:Dual specificity phosphatase n=1 Tax=Thecamonas trahens ATCC 50062 TaxID=461836 RepID=A0A0L0D5G1_THETB|nr:hypothetical protein AMSG_11722 [Thecamonas trahens ATCC 50062]KNC47602.1 hypothetical protein AMSG_11722 [Thecamonas trahens ATCC 50062]|eukprot:XP_013759566.1 hypothetical protein AMSG_11722 [Thecamonas trahens ATCC 50062]
MEDGPEEGYGAAHSGQQTLGRQGAGAAAAAAAALVAAAQGAAGVGMLPLSRAVYAGWHVKSFTSALGWSLSWFPLFYTDTSPSTGSPRGVAWYALDTGMAPNGNFLLSALANAALLTCLVAIIMAGVFALTPLPLRLPALRSAALRWLALLAAGLLAAASFVLGLVARGSGLALASVPGVFAMLVVLFAAVALALLAYLGDAPDLPLRSETRGFGAGVLGVHMLSLALACGLQGANHALPLTITLLVLAWLVTLALVVVRPYTLPAYNILACVSWGARATALTFVVFLARSESELPSRLASLILVWCAIGIHIAALACLLAATLFVAASAVRAATAPHEAVAKSPSTASSRGAILPMLSVLPVARLGMDDQATPSESPGGMGTPQAMAPLEPARQAEEAGGDGDLPRLDLTNIRHSLGDAGVSITARKSEELVEFALQVAPVAPGLFVGSAEASSNRELLEAAGVTNVINVAPMVCANVFEDADDAPFEYWALPLFDDPSQDITSVIYDVIEYVDEIAAEGGACFLHCSQGVSRSIALATAYLMHTLDMDYEPAAAKIKAIRPVADPNAGFVFQLLEWRARVTWQPTAEAPTPTQPALFRLAPQDRGHDPGYIVAKFVYLDDYWAAARSPHGPELPIVLDPRAVYIAFWDTRYTGRAALGRDGRMVLVWHGDKAEPDLASQVGDILLILQRFEHAPSDYRIVTPSATASFATLLRHGGTKANTSISVLVGHDLAVDDDYLPLSSASSSGASVYTYEESSDA